jgi:hypothetical protein
MHKSCKVCGTTRPLDDFYKHPQMADGRLNKCKQCCREAAKANRDARLDYYRQYDRERLSTENRKKTLAEKQRLYRARNRKKHEARMAVFRAIRAGVITKRPCEICGTFPADAHHDNYERPLDIRWLCRMHHLIEHDNYIQEPIVMEAV